MNKYNYDFSGLQDSMNKLKTNQSQTTLNNIKKELNKFFRDSECREIIFTKNTDKLFFGMCTYAIISNHTTMEILTDDEPVRIKEYSIEIDSKILEVGFTTRELTAIILHEVGHLVNDTSTSDEIRKAVDEYVADIGSELKLADINGIVPLFSFAIQDCYRKATSIFSKRNEEVIADQFVFLCGYGDDLESAFKKIVRQNKNINSEVNKFMVLDWTLRIYKDIGIHRTGAIKTLNRMNHLTGSKMQKNIIDKAVKGLQRINPNYVRECYISYESIIVSENGIVVTESGGKPKGLVEKIQKRGLKGIDEDLYEYSLRIKNVETEEEAMLILRQMNARMSVLDDYINYSDISEKERIRWETVYEKYYKLREELVKKSIYNRKNYGIWFDYNQLDR